MLRTRLTDLFGLTYPIVSAPMAGPAGGALAAAVSEAGGLGLIGAGGSPAAWVREQTAVAKAQTSKPFGAGFLTQYLEAAPEGFEAALEERLAVYAFSFGDPAPYIERVRAAGGRVLCQVQTLQQAARAVELGTDVLAVQGNEAGGHTGRLALLPFLAEAADAFPDVALLAAGGVGGGRALAAVLAAGADGAWIGTPFVATPESLAHDTYKQRIVDSDGTDSVYTEVYDIIGAIRLGRERLFPEGVAGRALRNPFVDEWHGQEEALRSDWERLRPGYEEAQRARDPQVVPLWGGPSAAAVTSVRPAAEVLRAIGEEAERLLRDRRD